MSPYNADPRCHVHKVILISRAYIFHLASGKDNSEQDLVRIIKYDLEAKSGMK